MSSFVKCRACSARGRPNPFWVFNNSLRICNAVKQFWLFLDCVDTEHRFDEWPNQELRSSNAPGFAEKNKTFGNAVHVICGVKVVVIQRASALLTAHGIQRIGELLLNVTEQRK